MISSKLFIRTKLTRNFKQKKHTHTLKRVRLIHQLTTSTNFKTTKIKIAPVAKITKKVPFEKVKYNGLNPLFLEKYRSKHIFVPQCFRVRKYINYKHFLKIIKFY